MRILLCNDDGISAPGIVELARALVEIGQVWVVAPDCERSAASSSLTLSQPLRVKEINFPVKVEKAFAVTGTPADCAKIALTNLLPQRPDVVVSGINRGPNMCVDIFYSGTVAAAFEGAFKGVLSVAVSLDSYNPDADYRVAASWGARCVQKLLASSAPKSRVYNVNVPDLADEQIKGLQITRSGQIDYCEVYDHRLDPNGRSYYWIQGRPEIVDDSSDCDVVAVRAGFVSMTPLRPDLTDIEGLQSLKSLFPVKKM